MKNNISLGATINKYREKLRNRLHKKSVTNIKFYRVLKSTKKEETVSLLH